MPHRVFVVGATGQLGRHFIPALRRYGHDVLVLLRPDLPGDRRDERTALVESLVQQGAKVVEGDLHDPRCLERACADVEAVVSCVDHRPQNLRLQTELARTAAKSGSVKRIIPSQFGIDSRTYGWARVNHGDVKRALQQEFDACGVPITYVHINGLATSWAASLGQLGLKSPPREQIEVYGNGNVKFSMVAPEDVALYASRTLFDPRTANQHVLISPPDNRLSQNELIAIWEDRTKTKLRRRTVSARELDERISVLVDDSGKFPELSFMQLIRAAWIDGLGDGRRRPDALELTELYPDIKYETISHYLGRLISVTQGAE
jgi:uncharacterized protein YbjT (DUF2867 family)